MSEFTTPDIAATDPIEARIVAWTLDEASVFEAAELARLCQADPVLQAFRMKMLALHGRLTAAGGAGDDGAWKLPTDKRGTLLRQFTVVPNAGRKGYGLRWALAIAACLALAGLFLRRENSRPADTLAMENSARPNLAERAAGDPYPINRRAGAKNDERQVLVTPLPAQRAPSPVAAELSAIPAAEMVQMTPLTNDREDALSFANARQELAAVTPQGDSVATGKLVARESAQASAAPISKETRPALRRQAPPSIAASPAEISATTQPYSTFIIPVGDASFQVAKSQLALGQRPDPAAIQPEQFYNAVDYRDPAASAADPVVATLEQSRHPLTPDRNLVRIALACRPGTQQVKIQVIFNPQRVGNYQLHGFKGTAGATAAEIGGSGTALYQIEPLASGRGDLGEISVRFRDQTTGEMVERSWTCPYTPEPCAFASAPPSMQLAGLSLLAAEKLKGGPFAERIDFKKLKESQFRVAQFYAGQPQVAEMLEVIRQITSSP